MSVYFPNRIPISYQRLFWKIYFLFSVQTKLFAKCFLYYKNKLFYKCWMFLFCANFHCLFQKIVFSQISSKVHLEHRVRRTLRSLRYLVISEFPTIPQEKRRLSFFHESSTNFTSIRIGVVLIVVISLKYPTSCC